MIVRREFRNPREIVSGFREERNQAEAEKRKRLREEYEAKKRSEGMSAAEAKRSVSAKPANEDIPRKPEASECGRFPEPIVAHHDLVIDGKVVKETERSLSAETPDSALRNSADG